MRAHIKSFVEQCEDYLNLPEPIYEFGSKAEGQHPEDVNLRPLFPKKHYVRSDFRDGANVDVILDLHDIQLEDESIGAAVCVETLEHVQYPWIAMEEMYRVLKPDGVLVATSVMHYPIHNHPSDYWRFTPAGFKVLFEMFEACWVDVAGDPTFPHTVVGIGWKNGQLPGGLDGFAKMLHEKQILRMMEHGAACK